MLPWVAMVTGKMGTFLLVQLFAKNNLSTGGAEVNDELELLHLLDSGMHTYLAELLLSNASDQLVGLNVKSAL
jgi:hypothetical protein